MGDSSMASRMHSSSRSGASSSIAKYLHKIARTFGNPLNISMGIQPFSVPACSKCEDPTTALAARIDPKFLYLHLHEVIFDQVLIGPVVLKLLSQKLLPTLLFHFSQKVLFFDTKTVPSERQTTLVESTAKGISVPMCCNIRGTIVCDVKKRKRND